MRIAFIGTESFANVALAVVENGHQLTHLFCPAKTAVAVSVRIEAVEQRAGIRAARRLVERKDLEAIHASGPDLILSAGYPTRLPVRPGDPVPGINIHPSPLPEGRGPRPYEWAILSGRTATAITFHELTERFDAGAVLLQVPLGLTSTETTASLDFRVRSLMAAAVPEFLTNFSALWANRQAQGPGSYCKVPSLNDRTIDLTRGVDAADRILRAFVPGDIFVVIGGRRWTVFDAVCWRSAPEVAPGSCVAQNGPERLFALADGYLLVRSALPPSLARVRRTITGLAARFR
ncbi:MAG: formyltransferase family protein [bacterium]